MITEYPYWVDIPFTSIDRSFKIQKWCDKQFGKSKVLWRMTSNRVNWQTYHFVNEADLVLFELKWV